MLVYLDICVNESNKHIDLISINGFGEMAKFYPDQLHLRERSITY